MNHLTSSTTLDRRRFLKTTAGVTLGAAAAGHAVPPLPAAVRRIQDKWLQVKNIKRTTVRLPFRETPDRNMARELPHWKWSEIIEVELGSGAVGIGETLLYYTWGATGDDDVQRVAGQNAAEWMWRDELGAGLQMALFDAVAKSGEVPIHRLLGERVHDRTPLAWWNIDTSAEDMAAECREAYEQGYRSYKTKGRPWFDVWRQVELAAQAVPEGFKLAIDFNDTLLDAERGIPILQDLEKYPQVAIWETPIPQTDIAGNQAIRDNTRPKVAMHYGRPAPRVAISEAVCDGFVIGGGARRVMQRGAVAAMADMPFWLQLVGTGITAAWSLQFGAVLTHATWPAVNCHQLYQHSLLAEPLRVVDGFAAIPTTPGLGFELDRDAVEKHRVAKPSSRPEPERLIEVSWLDGRQLYLGSPGRVNFVLNAGNDGTIPYFERGVNTRLVPDDGSSSWRELYDQAKQQPVWR